VTPLTRDELADVLGIAGPPGSAPVVARQAPGLDGPVIEVVAGDQVLQCPWRVPARPNGATVVLPWYDVDSMFAAMRPEPGLAVQRKKFPVADELLALGFAIVVVPWWAEAMGRRSPHADLTGRYGPPAAAMLAAGWRTALGRSLADVLAVVELLAQEPAQEGKLAVWGHSLAGKLSLFSAALDDRLQACVTHELGLGWEHSNWFEPWYLGEVRPEFDCDAVLALIAPRPVLYGAGHGFDAEPGLTMARSVRVGDWAPEIIEHHAGHRPTEQTRQQTCRWLAERLGVGIAA